MGKVIIDIYKDFDDWLFIKHIQDELMTDLDRCNYDAEEFKDLYRNYWLEWFNGKMGYSDVEDDFDYLIEFTHENYEKYGSLAIDGLWKYHSGETYEEWNNGGR